MSTEYSDCFLTKGNERQPMPDTGFARFARSDRGIRVVFEQLGLDVDQVERMVELLPYGAVEGSAARMENSNDIAWFSSRGLMIGTQDGQVKNMQEENIAVGAAQAGATLYREQDGMRQLVAAVSGAQESRAAANSFMTMEVVRKENML